MQNTPTEWAGPRRPHQTKKVKELMEDKGYALPTFLDIEGTFDQTNDVIEQAMSIRGFHETMIRWIQVMSNPNGPRPEDNGEWEAAHRDDSCPL